MLPVHGVLVRAEKSCPQDRLNYAFLANELLCAHCTVSQQNVKCSLGTGCRVKCFMRLSPSILRLFDFKTEWSFIRETKNMNLNSEGSHYSTKIFVKKCTFK